MPYATGCSRQGTETQDVKGEGSRTAGIRDEGAGTSPRSCLVVLVAAAAPLVLVTIARCCCRRRRRPAHPRATQMKSPAPARTQWTRWTRPPPRIPGPYSRLPPHLPSSTFRLPPSISRPSPPISHRSVPHQHPVASRSVPASPHPRPASRHPSLISLASRAQGLGMLERGRAEREGDGDGDARRLLRGMTLFSWASWGGGRRTARCASSCVVRRASCAELAAHPARPRRSLQRAHRLPPQRPTYSKSSVIHTQDSRRKPDPRVGHQAQRRPRLSRTPHAGLRYCIGTGTPASDRLPSSDPCIFPFTLDVAWISR